MRDDIQGDQVGFQRGLTVRPSTHSGVRSSGLPPRHLERLTVCSIGEAKQARLLSTARISTDCALVVLGQGVGEGAGHKAVMARRTSSTPARQPVWRRPR